MGLELTMCVNLVSKVKKMWLESDDEQCQQLASHLFDYVVFDLDKHSITDFRLKAWADTFLIVRGKLYEDEIKTPLEAAQEVYTDIVPTGLELTRLPLAEIVNWLLTSSGFKTISTHTRNELIRLRYVAGETLSDLARAFNISPQRVYQIVSSRSE